jgi:integrase
MIHSIIPFGTLIAEEVRDSSENCMVPGGPPRTLGDLLDILGQTPPRAFPMLRSTCSKVACYLDAPVSQIELDALSDRRDGFRDFLEGRRHAENSVRTYVNHLRILLNHARKLGWEPNESVPAAWRGVMLLAGEKKCADIVKYFSRSRKTPGEVTVADVDAWVSMRIGQGASSAVIGPMKSCFWRLLHSTGSTKIDAKYIIFRATYGTPMEQLPPGFRAELSEILRWKQAFYVSGRPEKLRFRAVSAKTLQQIVCGLFAYAVNIRGEVEITSLAQLVQKSIVTGFAEWCLNVREIKPQSVHHNLRVISAIMRQYPTFDSLDFSWFKLILDSLPTEPKSELKNRKAKKYLEYSTVESIPGKLRAERSVMERKNKPRLEARLTKEELIIQWLITLPWRQRNLRECRIGGPSPNLFKAKIPLFSDVEKPKWVIEEEQQNPEAEFWQFAFCAEETKTGIDVRAVLPRQLIGILEEYLTDFRPHLLRGPDPETLLLNGMGKPMMKGTMTQTVADLTLRYGGRRVPPHLFRDIVAYTWLHEHPGDYLTLSKMLWHANVTQVILVYGRRFNESSGVCAMDNWLEERAAKAK